MTELKIEHVLMLVIVAFVIYHLTSCRCFNNGFSVGGTDEPRNITLQNNGDSCPGTNTYPGTIKGKENTCLSNYYTDDDGYQKACYFNSGTIPHYSGCQEYKYIPDPGKITPGSGKDKYFSCFDPNYVGEDLCPHCNNLSSYSLPKDCSGSGCKCTSDHNTCLNCIKPENKVNFSSTVNASGLNRRTYRNQTSPITFVQNNMDLHTFCPNENCSKTADDCVKEIKPVINELMSSSNTCTLSQLESKIENASGVFQNCKDVPIAVEDHLLKYDILDRLEYCNPSPKKNIWKCDRGELPDYCKYGICVLSEDGKCGCPVGKVPLQDAQQRVTCGGFPTCPGSNKLGTCPLGKVPTMEAISGPMGIDVPMCVCK